MDRSLVCLLAVTGVVVGGASLLAPLPVEAQSAPRRAALPPEQAAVADLDLSFQSIFSDVSKTKPRKMKVRNPDGTYREVALKPEFGVTRVESALKGHGLLGAHASDRPARERLARVRSGWHVMVSCLHNGGKALNPAAMSKDVLTWEEGLPRDWDTGIAKGSFAEITRLGRSSRKVNGWYVEARAVRMSKRDCLSCHTWGKLGDPVGIMVYAVRPKNSPSKASR